MKDSKMSIFIQAIYGSVFGVSFYDFTKNCSNTLPTNIFFEQLIIFPSTNNFFYFLLFIFTIVIITHDWFYYHSNNINTANKKQFWRYIPQIFSLFFIAQMFYAITHLNFQYWYAFGFGYTLCNATTFLINLNSSIEKRSLLFNLAKYISHLLLTIQCFIIPSDFILPYYYLSFGITVLIVITFWCLDGKIQKQEPTSKDSTNSTLTSDLETINNTITNTENELITKIKEVKSLLKDVIDKIKDIKNKI